MSHQFLNFDDVMHKGGDCMMD